MSTTGTDPDRMTAWQFLRWFASNHDGAQRGALAATATICTIAAACWPALGSPLATWAAVLAGAASLTLYVAITWLVLGSQRVQRWVIGHDPAGPSA